MNRLKVSFDVQLDFDVTYGNHEEMTQRLLNLIVNQFKSDSTHIENLNIYWYGDLKIANEMLVST